MSCGELQYVAVLYTYKKTIPHIRLEWWEMYEGRYLIFEIKLIAPSF